MLSKQDPKCDQIYWLIVFLEEEQMERFAGMEISTMFTRLKCYRTQPTACAIAGIVLADTLGA